MKLRGMGTVSMEKQRFVQAIPLCGLGSEGVRVCSAHICKAVSKPEYGRFYKRGAR